MSSSPAPNLAQFVIVTKSVQVREQLRMDAGRCSPGIFSVRTRITRLKTGRPSAFRRSFASAAPRSARCRQMAEQVAGAMRADRDATNVQFDWDEPGERSVHFDVDQLKARELNISSEDIDSYLQMSLTGYAITQFRERDKLDQRGSARAAG